MFKQIGCFRRIQNELGTTLRGCTGRPWQGTIHGLTFERMSLPGELAPEQKRTLQNWAVGMYNAPGGLTIGKSGQPSKPEYEVIAIPGEHCEYQAPVH